MYKLLKLPTENAAPTVVQRLSDGACIPFHPDNTDYQEYLKWLSEGNTPEAAE